MKIKDKTYDYRVEFQFEPMSRLAFLARNAGKLRKWGKWKLRKVGGQE